RWGETPAALFRHDEARAAERETVVERWSPRHRESVQRARVVRRILVEVRGFAQLAKDPLRVERPSGRTRGPRLNERVGKSGRIVAQRDRVLNARPPPEVFRRKTKGDHWDIHRHTALTRVYALPRAIAEAEGEVDRFGQRVKRIGPNAACW